MVRYWVSLHDEKHPIVFDRNDNISYCISCQYGRSVSTLKNFKGWHSDIREVNLFLLAQWIDQFKNEYEFRKDKIKEIATHLLIGV